MRTLVFFLEEPSAREMLEGLVPRILPPNVLPQFIVFEGKHDLEKRLGKRLRGWLKPDSFFMVLLDQDSGHCELIKERLTRICKEAGRPETLVRIACRELESWYFGELRAVEAGLNCEGLAKLACKAKYREPDSIVNPAAELLKVTAGAYQKVAGSRLIGHQLSVTSNSSRSFQVFVDGIRRLLQLEF